MNFLHYTIYIIILLYTIIYTLYTIIHYTLLYYYIVILLYTVIYLLYYYYTVILLYSEELCKKFIGNEILLFFKYFYCNYN